MGGCCVLGPRANCKIEAKSLPFVKQQKTISDDDIFSRYKFEETIGKGSFSKVKIASKLVEPSQKRIVKIIEKSRLGKGEESFKNELEILMELDHPNIVHVFEAFADQKHFYLVMEYLKGPSLLEKVTEKKDYDDLFVKKVLYQILSAVHYLHSVGVCHRDLKPANVILVSPDSSEIKLIDFGLSKKGNTLMESCLGTPYYVAPEVLNKQYSFQCDVWSVGIIATVLFTGKPYFRDRNRADLLHKIKTQSLRFDSEEWVHVSPSAKSFIGKLLRRDPNARIAPKEALQDCFFDSTNETIHNTRKIDKEILKSLREFNYHESFKKLVLSCLVKTLPEEELVRLNKAFNAMDLDHEGFIDLTELKKAFLKAEIDIEEEETEEMLSNLDSDGNGRLNYSEFLVAAANIKKAVKDKQMQRFFESVDPTKDGYIDGKKMKNMLSRRGRLCETREIEKMIADLGSSNKRISFEQFVQMFDENK